VKFIYLGERATTKGVGYYILVDVLIIYSIIKQLSTTLRVENIFDVKYNDKESYTARGKRFYLALCHSM
jgi:vitamin B12 transporter